MTATPTTATAAPAAGTPPPAPERPAPRATDQALLTATAADAFAAAGLDGLFATARPTFERIRQLERDRDARRKATTDHERAVASRLAAGELDVDQAAAELAAAQATRLDEVVDRALRALRRRLEADTARDAARGVTELGRLLGEATARAVAAGRECCDVAAVARAIQSPSGDGRVLVPSMVADAPTRPAWPEAVAATARVTELRRLAGMLVRLGGPPVRYWSGKRPIGQPELVEEVVPEPLVIAVGDALGWKPGLVAVPGLSGVPFDLEGGDGGRAERAEQMRRAPVLGALRHRIDQLATGR